MMINWVACRPFSGNSLMRCWIDHGRDRIFLGLDQAGSGAALRHALVTEPTCMVDVDLDVVADLQYQPGLDVILESVGSSLPGGRVPPARLGSA